LIQNCSKIHRFVFGPNWEQVEKESKFEKNRKKEKKEKRRKKNSQLTVVRLGSFFKYGGLQ
jgi:hypothetical protein